MRPLRDWAWKKLPDDDIRAQGEAMRKEEIEEYNNILASFPGLEDYIKSGKKTSDFIREYDSLGWEMRPWEFHFTKFNYSLEHAPRTKEGLIDVASEASSDIDDYYVAAIPDNIISTFALPVIPEKYKDWSFAVRFGDNDFGREMKKVGEIVGQLYLDDLKGICRDICLFEDCERDAVNICSGRLDKYFNKTKILLQLDNLLPGIYNLCQFEFNGYDPDQKHAQEIREYLKLDGREVKAIIGKKDDIKSWIDLAYMDADTLVISVLNGKELKVKIK